MSPLFRADAMDFPQIRCSISFLFTVAPQFGNPQLIA
jgi:hypothetical protein